VTQGTASVQVHIPFRALFKVQAPTGVVPSGVSAAPVEVVFFRTANVSVRPEHVRLDRFVVARITAFPMAPNAVMVGRGADMDSIVVVMIVVLDQEVQVGPEIHCRMTLILSLPVMISLPILLIPRLMILLSSGVMLSYSCL
jgi:hypothetical protein